MDNKILDISLDYLNTGSLDSIKEAYIGKSPILLKIEDKIGELRKRKITEPFDNTKLVNEINSLFEKQFGMHIFSLHIQRDYELNAFCIPIGRMLDNITKDMRDMVVGNPNTGYRFAKNNGLAIIVNVTYGVLAEPRFTNAAIVATILHEIGHCFSECLYNDIELANREYMQAWSDALLAYGTYEAVLIRDQTTNKYNVDVETRNKKKKPNKLLSFLSGTKAKIGNSFSNLSYAIYMSGFFGKAAIKNMQNGKTPERKEESRNDINRKEEVFADRFPMIYGYGVDQAESEFIYGDITYQTRDAYKLALKLPGSNSTVFNYQKELFDINDYDSHPNALQRVNADLAMLKREVQKEDLDSRVKAELESQISEIEKIIDKAMDAKSKVSNLEKARANYYAYIQQTCPTAVSDDYDAIIDDILDKALEEQEKKQK